MGSDLSSSLEKECVWREHIKAWEKGVLSQQDYCLAQEIKFSSFGYWRKRFNREVKASVSPRFVEAKLPDSGQHKTPVIQILLTNGVRVGVSAEAPPEMIRILLNAVNPSFYIFLKIRAFTY